jgi:hypothetical protein
MKNKYLVSFFIERDFMKSVKFLSKGKKYEINDCLREVMELNRTELPQFNKLLHEVLVRMPDEPRESIQETVYSWFLMYLDGLDPIHILDLEDKDVLYVVIGLCLYYDLEQERLLGEGRSPLPYTMVQYLSNNLLTFPFL